MRVHGFSNGLGVYWYYCRRRGVFSHWGYGNDSFNGHAFIQRTIEDINPNFEKGKKYVDKDHPGEIAVSEIESNMVKGLSVPYDDEVLTGAAHGNK